MDSMKRLLFACGVAAAVLGSAPAHADPDQGCYLQDRLLCLGPSGGVAYCPDTQTWMGWLGNCPSITFGRAPVPGVNGTTEPTR
jgi:hypothetical protein